MWKQAYFGSFNPPHFFLALPTPKKSSMKTDLQFNPAMKRQNRPKIRPIKPTHFPALKIVGVKPQKQGGLNPLKITTYAQEIAHDLIFQNYDWLNGLTIG